MTDEQKKQAALAALAKLQELPYTLGFPLKWRLSSDGLGIVAYDPKTGDWCEFRAVN